MMDADVIERIESYRAEVLGIFGELFAADAGRFADGQRLLRRFNEAVDHALNSSPLSAFGEAHNELCVARALLRSSKPRFSSLAYEPPLNGCAKTIDFCGKSDEGLIVYVDVKTIAPVPKDRWEQFEKAQREKWFPENVRVGLYEEWMGGETWHGWSTGRGRMLEYTLELEEKIRKGDLKGQKDTSVILALCGTGFDWHESQLEDFADFYRSGRYRSDDSFAKMEAHFMTEQKIGLDRTVTGFAYLERKKTAILPAVMHWNVRGPVDPERVL
jgi:hypothetical protein